MNTVNLSMRGGIIQIIFAANKNVCNVAADDDLTFFLTKIISAPRFSRATLVSLFFFLSQPNPIFMVYFTCCLRLWQIFPKKIILKAFACLVFLLSLFVAEKARAQNTAVSVSGRITDENDELIPGASVQLKGTSIGTLSDDRGAYAIQGDGGGGGYSPVFNSGIRHARNSDSRSPTA